MKTLLDQLIQYHTLTKQQAKEVLIDISKDVFHSNQIASFLTVFMMRNITVEELEGFREALLELCIQVDLSDYESIDLCGTGGDGKDTFNISTLSSFVVGSTGMVNVTKHGNYGVSSNCGSSNVLEHLGIRFSNDKAFLQTCLEKAGVCVLHAPLFHPAMKNVAPIRRTLGVKTFFNMLGPMVNPAFPKHQLVGVFNLELARMYSYLYQNTDTNFRILHSLDGYDEVSLTGKGCKTITKDTEQIVQAEDFGIASLQANTIVGGKDIAASAKLFMQILKGNGTDAQNHVVCANSAMAITTVKPEMSLQDAFLLAKEHLLSGKAFKTFSVLKSLS